MALKLAYHTLPHKTYDTHEKATRAFTKACDACGITDMEFLIAASPGGVYQFFPVALPTANQIQNGINLARHGITAVRT